MKVLVSFLVISAIFVVRSHAQPQVDSVWLDLKDIWVHYSYSHREGHLYEPEEDSYNHALSLNRNCMVNSSIKYGNLYFSSACLLDGTISFDEDTTHLTATFHTRTGDLLVTIGFGYAPVVNTSTAYIVDLDSAEIETNFSYSAYYSWQGGLGAYTYIDESLQKPMLPTSRAQLILFKKLTSDVGDASKQIGFAVYPNPVIKTLTVRSEPGYHIPFAIYDILGRKVFSDSVEGMRQLDVSGFLPGIYIVSSGSEYRRIIVK